MILIDSVYINELGGEALLKYFIESLESKKVLENYFFLFDNRIKFNIKFPNAQFLKASETNRFIFYKKNKNKFSKVLCFANIPPPLNVSIETFIYFHNALLLDLNNTNFSFPTKAMFAAKRNYIKIINKKKYFWIVQTELIKKKLCGKFRITDSKVKVLPFYFDNFKNLNKKKSPSSFLYVSGFLPHKNHYRLIRAFSIAAKKFKNNIHLNLTLKSEDFRKLILSFSKLPPNLIIENLGVLSLDEINLAYEKNQNLIFPSLKESFGLPLIEATLKKLNVISSKLDYVNYVIEPSLSFNPLDIEDISNSILKTLTLKRLKKPNLVSKNKIDKLINILSSV